jgi:hypothetical protein
MYKLANLREFNETLNYHSQRIIGKGFFVTDYNAKLKKIQERLIEKTKICGSCSKLKLLKNFLISVFISFAGYC